MKFTNNNGHKTVVLEPEPVKDIETLSAAIANKTANEEIVLAPEKSVTLPKSCNAFL